jgi:DNA-binding beta-propeller fold protein YncE
MLFANKIALVPLILGGAGMLGLILDSSLGRAAESQKLKATSERVAFVQKPSATAVDKGVKIAFEVSAPTDVEVAVLGADGKVVRHLAAGVLGGKHPPPEPLKAGLAQEILWDAKDDFGKLAAGGPFKVRVRAAMGVQFGRFIGQDPYFLGGSDGLVVGDDGNLYTLGAGTRTLGDECAPTLRVFSPEGKYLKTLMPFPSNLPPGAMKDVARWDEASKTWRPRNESDMNAEFYRTSGFRNSLYTSNIQLLAASKKTGIILVAPGSGAVYRLDLQGGVSGETLATGVSGLPSDIGKALHDHVGPECYCVSPDGKYLYLSGPRPGRKPIPKFRPGSVWRTKLDGSEAKMSTFVVLPSTPDGPWSQDGGKIHGAFGPVHGVAADLKGTVYVCDREKNRVAVFDEGGKEIGAISVKNPDSVALHPKTGAIYVLRRFNRSYEHFMTLDKFNNFENGAVAAASYANFHPRNFPKMAVTVSGNRTLVWFTGATYADKPRLDDTKLTEYGLGGRPVGLIALEDKGDAFQPVVLPYGPQPDGPNGFSRIATDPLREEVYVSNDMWECIITNGMICRFNGDTGAGGPLKKDGKILYAEDLTVGHDGLLYVKSGPKMSGPFERLTRDLAPVPFPGIATNNLTNTYVRCGEKGVGVGPDGKVYTCIMYDEGKFFVSGWNPEGLPLEGKYLAGKIEKAGHVLPFQGKLPENRKTRSALIGPLVNNNVAGMRVDLKGNIYLGMCLLPKGYRVPAGLEKVPNYQRCTGSVVKFRPQGGAVLGLPGSESKDAAAPKLETNDNRLSIEGGLAMYPGLAPLSGRGTTSHGCWCRGPRFDLDRYGRLALPNAFSTSVAVMDNAGNVIVEFGKYGNFDSQYVPPDAKDGKPLIGTPEIPLAWPVGAGFTEKAIYVTDNYNRRVVRADMTWKAEEICAIK